jgi:hypothetical protein
MSNQMVQLQEATIKAHCKALHMPMITSQFGTLAEQAIREKKNHMGAPAPAHAARRSFCAYHTLSDTNTPARWPAVASCAQRFQHPP